MRSTTVSDVVYRSAAEDFVRFCSERFGENGCQTSKTIAREKGQKTIHRLRNDPIADTCGS